MESYDRINRKKENKIIYEIIRDHDDYKNHY